MNRTHLFSLVLVAALDASTFVSAASAGPQAVANDDHDFFVYTPPGYDVRPPQPYPVL